MESNGADQVLAGRYQLPVKREFYDAQSRIIAQGSRAPKQNPKNTHRSVPVEIR
jgi:hypothetical protein